RLTYKFGTSSLWITFAQAVAFPMAWFLLAKRMRLMAEVRNVLSLPDAVAARYRSNGARFWMAVALLFGVLGYLGTQVQAMGVVMQTIFGIDLVTGALIGLAILTIYTMMGGILAGVYTDFFQGVIMIFASVGVFLWCMNVGGGMTNISNNVALADPKLMGPWGGMPIMTALTWYFLFAIGNAGQPHMATKLYMTRDIYRLKWGGFVSAVAYALCALLWMSLGLTMRSLVESGKHAPLANPDLTATTFLMEYTPEVLAGIVLAGLMAAIMSTGNSFLNLGAAALVRDIPQAFGKKVENEVFWARLATLGLVVVSTFFALYMKTLVALLGVFG
ncbi:MAG: sodium/proline symporter, partial [Moorella sp. (in: Bacteria)]|nr:sodium/proline symporter [Moorella sp. (in: firmicutes)]